MNQENKACVVIPVYQKISDSREVLSLKQGLKVFKNYPIIFICPESFDRLWIEEYCQLHPNITFKKFPDKNFVSEKSYSLLISNYNFYTEFLDYKWMLIYQLDAYVFRDDLKFWCDKEFDFIGAPWTSNSSQSFKNFLSNTVYKTKYQLYPNAGNGGFSLRNIRKINELMSRKISFLKAIKVRKILKKFRNDSQKRNSLEKRISEIRFFFRFFFTKPYINEVLDYILHNNFYSAEDVIFAIAYPKIFPQFRVAKAEEAIGFSFESEPEKLYRMNGGRLPFGCHAWYKISPEFWKKFIN